MKKTNYIKGILLIVALVLLNGCSSNPVEPLDSRDPWENWNRKVQSFNDGLDDYGLKPVAKGYRWIMPGFADTGVTNVFSNIRDIGVFLNDFMQFKIKQGGLDFSRFIVNSTAGLGGLFDVASMINLPKHNEDFGQTLGVWGVPTGPYVVLPLFGPSSPRGTVGLVGDAAMNPLSYINYPLATGLAGALNIIDIRADNLGAEKTANEAIVDDRYQFFRDAYLQRREYLVNDGEIPEGEDSLEDDLEGYEEPDDVESGYEEPAGELREEEFEIVPEENELEIDPVL